MAAATLRSPISPNVNQREVDFWHRLEWRGRDEVGARAPKGAPAVSNENGLSFEAQFELPRHAKNLFGRVGSNTIDIEPRWACWANVGLGISLGGAFKFEINIDGKDRCSKFLATFYH